MKSPVAALCALFTLILHSPPAVATTRATSTAEFTALIGCAGTAGEYTLRIRSEFYLNARFTGSTGPRESIARAAALQQLRYVSGGFFNAPDFEMKKIVPAEGSVEIEELRISDALYPIRLTVDAIPHPEVQIDLPYLKAAIAAGKTNPGDPAWKVSYVATVRAAACIKENAKPGVPLVEGSPISLRVRVPVDPYLFYWSVTPASRRPIRWKRSFFQVNPCADAEVADLPDPYYFWYFWNPVMKGTDDQAQGFDCSQLLEAGRDYVEIPVTLENPVRPPPATAGPGITVSRDAGRKQQASVLFGIIDPKMAVTKPEELARAFGKTGHSFERGLRELARPSDRGSLYFLAFLNEIPQLMKIRAYQLKTSKTGTVVTVDGTLKDSRRDLELKVFFGHTDLLGPEKPQHWDFLWSALKQDDLIVYNGHSGLGKNAALESIADGLGIPLPTVQASVHHAGPRGHQVIGYFSCFSYAYFGDDILAARRGEAGSTELIFTGTSFTSERGPLAMIRQMDARLQDPKLAPAALLDPPYLAERDFIIVKRLSQPSQL